MSDLSLYSQRIKEVMDELVTYENITKNDPIEFFGMIAERLNCVCIDKENLQYIYINGKGEIEGGCDMYILNKVIKLAMKNGYKDMVRKCWPTI